MADDQQHHPRPIQALAPSQFANPAILLAGPVDFAMYDNFRRMLAAAPAEGIVVVELSTLGGDPEVARMMGEDIAFHSKQEPGRHFAFLGKAAIYSAGATFMGFFQRDNRYLTRGARLMIHERKMSTQLTIEGPLTTCVASLKAKLNEIEHSIRIQNEDFESLIRGSSVSMEEVLRKAPENWYIEAADAKKLGLIRDVI
ncbi:peptidase S14 [Bosea sp. RCC_152_1]|uniref:peptidase S14 n=1 Tax=Bosea sp. RCC_152_1 TaxID=3239228 RepID=UPI00352479C5